MKYFTCLFLIFSMLSCKDKTPKMEVENRPSVQKTVEADFSPPVYLDTLKSTEEILQHISERTRQMEQLLSSATPEQAERIYHDFRKENDSALVLLMKKNAFIEEKFSDFYDYDTITQKSFHKIPDSLKGLVKNFEKVGIEFWDIGEGYTDLRMKPDYYYKLFNGKLSTDSQHYLHIITEEDKILFSADASIVIPWRDVAKRIEVREDFLKNFPKSKLRNTIQDELSGYRYAYLHGYDNTMTFDRKSFDDPEVVFNKENLNEFRRFSKDNPESETTQMIMEMISRKFNTDEFSEWVQKRTGFHW